MMLIILAIVKCLIVVQASSVNIVDGWICVIYV